MTVTRHANTAGTFNTNTSSGNIAHGASGSSNFAFVVMMYNMNGTSTNAVNSMTDSDGHTWHRYGGASMTQLHADSPGPSVDCFAAIEVWYTNGAAFTAGGTFHFTFPTNVDGCAYWFQSYTGIDAANPFDPNASNPGTHSVTASADCGVSMSTTNADDVILQCGLNVYSTFNGDGKVGAFSTGNNNQGIFSGAVQAMRAYFDYTKTPADGGQITTPQSGLGCGWTAALGTGPVANMLVYDFAITGDPTIANPNNSKTTATVIQ